MSLMAADAEEDWSYDTIDEFLAHYRVCCRCARLGLDHYPSKIGFKLYTRGAYQRHPETNVKSWGWQTHVSIRAKDRPMIESLFAVFESNLADSQELPAPNEEEQLRPVIFIGHGHSALWRALKDHLQDLHGYVIEAFETGARAGHASRDILGTASARPSVVCPAGSAVPSRSFSAPPATSGATRTFMHFFWMASMRRTSTGKARCFIRRRGRVSRISTRW